MSALCEFDHPLTLPPALHVLGVLFAMAAIEQLACRAWRRRWRPADISTPPPNLRLPSAVNLRGRRSMMLDGWTALGAHVPPKERRGLVLVDPPFEEERDFSRLVRDLAGAHRKWATGIYILAKQLRRLGIGKTLRAEMTVAPLDDPGQLNGCGLVLVNPPWTLEDELAVLLPVLAERLGSAGAVGGRPGFSLDWLAGERLAGAE